MSAPRIGSLCSGYGGLTMATHSVIGGELAWYAQYEPPDKNGREDKHQYTARIMAHHWPDLPNHGDITRTDWTAVKPVDILEAGFPCQPVSNAGKRKGADDDRWLWPDVARAIRQLRPRIVLLENVAALLGRGMPAVLGDLAEIGFDAQWITLRASDVGAPHQRARVFIVAWPAAYAAHDGLERGRLARSRRPGPADSDQDSTDAQGDGRDEGRPEPARLVRGLDAALGSGAAPADPDGQRLARRTEQDREPHGPGLHAPRRNDPLRRDQAAPDADGRRWGPDEPDDAARQPDVAWGAYAGAITRWRHVLDRPAPAPVDAAGRLSPVFVEWLMGLPAGHVTDVPGLPRSAQLKALGNGVVPQQGAAALRSLLAAAGVS